MTATVIPTQPIPDHIQVALDALSAVPADDEDFELALRATAAMAVLQSGTPMYPPLLEPAATVPAARAIEVALVALERAVVEATTVEEATRAGSAGAVLRGAPVAWFA